MWARTSSRPPLLIASAPVDLNHLRGAPFGRARLRQTRAGQRPCAPAKGAKQRSLRIARQACAVQVGVQVGFEIVMAGWGDGPHRPKGNACLPFNPTFPTFSYPLRSGSGDYFVIRLGEIGSLAGNVSSTASSTNFSWR